MSTPFQLWLADKYREWLEEHGFLVDHDEVLDDDEDSPTYEQFVTVFHWNPAGNPTPDG